MGEQVRAALWLRVSDGEQEAGNQAPELEDFAAHRGYAIAARFRLDGESAWKDTAAYRKALACALDGAHKGKFKVIIVWALDRLTREGAEGALRLIRQFRERGVEVVSLHEPWLNGSPEVADILVAFAGWMAEQESKRRSERIKAGNARRLAEGKPLGRKPGSKDLKPRRRSAYVASWEEGGARRARAQEAGRP